MLDKDYFKIKWKFSYESNGNVRVFNFHPLWREASQELYSSNEIIEDLRNIERLFEGELKIPFKLKFNSEIGLEKIKISSKSSLDLIVDKEVYESYNLIEIPHITLATTFMQKYVNYLKDIISDSLERKEL
jgi:hypothetical protein